MSWTAHKNSTHKDLQQMIWLSGIYCQWDTSYAYLQGCCFRLRHGGSMVRRDILQVCYGTPPFDYADSCRWSAHAPLPYCVRESPLRHTHYPWDHCSGPPVDPLWSPMEWPLGYRAGTRKIPDNWLEPRRRPHPCAAYIWTSPYFYFFEGTIFSTNLRLFLKIIDRQGRRSGESSLVNRGLQQFDIQQFECLLLGGTDLLDHDDFGRCVRLDFRNDNEAACLWKFFHQPRKAPNLFARRSLLAWISIRIVLVTDFAVFLPLTGINCQQYVISCH